MFKEEKIKKLEDYCILEGYRGSIAHGTYVPDSDFDDKDVMGVFIPPRDVVFGIKHMGTVSAMWSEKISQKKTILWDYVYYTLPKYLSLLVKQNPNVIMLLWLSEKHYIKRTPLGNKLIENREKLLSKDCYHSFCGYAYGQLHRMTHHSSTGRMGSKRKALVKKFGYDVKNASHLIRLLKMGLETLATGEMIVERPDNNMLLEIKRGEWSLDRVVKKSDELFKRLDEALLVSKLENHVDRDFVNRLCMEIMTEFYHVGKYNKLEDLTNKKVFFTPDTLEFTRREMLKLRKRGK